MDNPWQVLIPLAFFTAWLFFAKLLIHFYKHGDKLFELLSRKSSGYYSEIGRPRYFSFNPLRNARAQRYLQMLLVRGLPKNFPKNKEAVAIATQIRKQSLKLHITFGIMILLVLFGMVLG